MEFIKVFVAPILDFWSPHCGKKNNLLETASTTQMFEKIFPYSKKSFMLDLVVYSVAAAIIILLLVYVARLDTLSTAVGTLIMAAILIVFGVSPLLTDHEVVGDRIVLRQGWYFRASIQIGSVKKIEHLEKGPLRTGVFFLVLQPTLYITSKRHDLVMLELREKRRFGWALGKRADKIVFDVTEPDRFFRTIEERRGLIPSSQGRSS